MRENSSVGKDSIRTFAFNIGQSVFAMLTGIAIAKALGPAGKGEYGLLQLLQAAGAGVTGNLGLSITYELTRKKKPFAELVRPLSLILGTLCVLEWSVVGTWIWLKGPDPAPLLFAATVPALILLSWQGPIFLGLGWIRSLNVQGLYFAGITFVAAVVTLYVFHLGTVGAMWGWVFCVWTIAISIVVRTLPESRGCQTDTTGSIVRQLLGFGLKASLGGVFGFISARVDQIATVTLMGASAFGIYSVAVSASEMLLRVTRSVAQAATARVGASEKLIAARMAAKASRASVAIIMSVGLFMFAAAPWLVTFFYGTRFNGAIDALRILLPGIAAVSCLGTLSTFFNYQLGRPMFLVYSSIFSASVETALLFILVPRMGLNGAALASTITYLIGAIVMTWYFSRKSGLSPIDVWVPRLADLQSIAEGFRKIAARSKAKADPPAIA